MFKGYLFDLDGTVYLGERLIPGAERAIRLLREAGKKVVFLSNKPLYTREDYAAKLTRLGIPTAPAEVVNSTFVLIRYLQRIAPGAKVFVMGELPFVAEMARAGFGLTEDPAEIEYVVAAFDRTFDYRKYNVAFQAIRKGAHFIATNPDRTCPVEGGELPDCAGVIAALEAVTLKKVEVIVGKPSPITVQVALEVMGLKAADCILIGDRLETDILGAVRTGIRSIMVLTGVSTEDDLKDSNYQPTWVMPDIRAVTQALRNLSA